MKKWMLGWMLLGVGVSAIAQNKVTIKGIVTTDTKAFNKIYIYGNDVREDSATISNGVFSIDIPFEKPFMVLMYAQYTISNGGMYAPFGLLIDKPGVISVDNIDLDKGMETGKVSGIESAVLYNFFNQQTVAEYEKVNKDLTDKFGKFWAPENDPQFKEIETEREILAGKYIGKLVKDFVLQHPGSYASVMVLSGQGRSVLSLEEQERIFAKLSKKMQQTKEGKGIPEFIEGSRNSSIGSLVKDFTLKTPDEKQFSLNSFKGKYLLIDFWASWCMPCKQSFPHMKEVYKAYRSSQFEIYSISIDQNKAAWLKAVKEEAFPWPQSLDTDNIAHKGFAVTGVPTTYLLDPTGKILAKDVGFDPEGNSTIEKKLVELFGQKLAKKPVEEKKRGEAIPAARLQ